MAAPVPPGAPRPGYNSQLFPSGLRPPDDEHDFQTNPDTLADNMHNLNINRPPSMPNSGPRPSPGFPVGSQPTIVRPAPPQNMPPLRPGLPLALIHLPPPPESLPHPMVSPSIPPPGSSPCIDLQPPGLPSVTVSASMPPPGSQSSPSLSASSGPLSNEPPAFARPRFPPATNAPQPPLGLPPTLASARGPPQAPNMRSVMESSPLSALEDAPVQLLSPFSAAAQGIPTTSGLVYELWSWPLQPQLVTPPHPVPGSAQSLGIFGMPPPPPSHSMTTITPALDQSGTPWPGESMGDPHQIRRPEPSSSVIIYETNHVNQANPPPSPTSDFILIDKGNCSPRYMRSTISQVPCTSELLSMSGMELALLVQPLALPHPSEEPVQIVDLGKSGPVRCSRCQAYINPFMKFIDHGRHFTCNLCGFTNETPRDYHYNLGCRDADDRPELTQGTVEFVASKDYMLRDPMPALYFFLIDVSMNALQTGATAAACRAISQVITDLPEGPRTMMGVATFDSTIHFYNLKCALQQPLMLIVPDVQDVYIPLQTDVIVQLSECCQHLELLLENIPKMFQCNKTRESAFGAAIKAAFLAMKNTGGKLLVFQSVLPSAGIGTLSSREADGMSNISAGEKAHKLLRPADNTLKTMAIEFAEYQVCVDVFITTQAYVDIASISVIPRTTGGQVYYYYPFSALSDSSKLYNDLRWNITRPQGFEAVMRVRCSQGIEVHEYSGNFCKRVPTDVDLPGIDCDKSFMVTLKHDGKLPQGDSGCAFQCALIYTTVCGQRRIRITNLSLPCTNIISSLFCSADLDALFVSLLKQAANEIPFSPLLHVREQVMNFCIKILVSYRKFCATVSSSGQLVLPESLKFLPLYTLALLKSSGLRTNGRIDDRSCWINHVSFLCVPLAISLVFPRMVAIHDLNSVEENGSIIPPNIPLSKKNLSEEGIFLLENGEECIIFIGNLVDSNILQQLFGISSVDEIPTQFMLQQYDNPLSKKFNDVVNEIRRERCSYLRLRFCQQGDPSGIFVSNMIEDKNPNGPSYFEFLVQIHREIQKKLSL